MTLHTILLVPADHFYWFGLERLLRGERGVRVLDPARDADDAPRAAAAHHPTFIIVDAALENAPIVALVAELRAHSPRSKVIAIGPPLRHEEHQQLLALQLACYLRWDEVSPERLRCIMTLVHDADMWVASWAVAEMLAPPDRRRRPRERGPVLSERERTVMAGLAAGRTREEIATRAHLSPRKVKRTIATLCETFDAPSMFVLGMRAALHGFTPADARPEGAMAGGPKGPSNGKR